MARILRLVDGLPHVLLGPIALALTSPLSEVLGVPEAGLIIFLLGFTAYGVLVLTGLHFGAGRVPTWLAAIALIVNGGFLGVVTVSLTSPMLTAAGRLAHAAVLLSGLVVTAALSAAVTRTYQPVSRAT